MFCGKLFHGHFLFPVIFSDVWLLVLMIIFSVCTQTCMQQETDIAFFSFILYLKKKCDSCVDMVIALHTDFTLVELYAIETIELPFKSSMRLGYFSIVIESCYIKSQEKQSREHNLIERSKHSFLEECLDSPTRFFLKSNKEQLYSDQGKHSERQMELGYVL